MEIPLIDAISSKYLCPKGQQQAHMLKRALPFLSQSAGMSNSALLLDSHAMSILTGQQTHHAGWLGLCGSNQEKEPNIGCSCYIPISKGKTDDQVSLCTEVTAYRLKHNSINTSLLTVL